MSNDVPPTSAVTTLCAPSTRAMSRAPISPAIGPPLKVRPTVVLNKLAQPPVLAAVVKAAGGRLEQVGAAAGVVDHEERPAVAALAQLVPRAGELDLHRALEV